MDSKELEKLNEDYLMLKKDLGTEKVNCMLLERRIETKAEDRHIAYAGYLTAKRNSSPDLEVKKAAYEEAEKKLAEEKVNLQKLESKVEEISEKIKSCIMKLEKDPEFKAYMQEAMQKRYNNKTKKHYEALQENLDDKNVLDSNKEVIQRHPEVQEKLKEIVLGTKTFNETKEMYKEVAKTENRELNQSEIDDLKKKSADIELNKKAILKYFEKSTDKLPRKEIDEIVRVAVSDEIMSRMLVEGKDFSQAMQRKEKSLNRKINYNDKMIVKYGRAVKMRMDEEAAIKGETAPSIEIVEEVVSKIEKDEASEEAEEEVVEEEEKKKGLSALLEKIKGFWTRRKQKGLPEATDKEHEEEAAEEEKEDDEKEEKKSKFKLNFKMPTFSLGKKKEKEEEQDEKDEEIEEEIEEIEEIEAEVIETEENEEKKVSKSSHWRTSFKYDLIADYATLQEKVDIKNVDEQMKSAKENDDDARD